MGQRRMVSSRIINSAKFLQMPGDAQLFYFHLITRADDDGVVESYPLIKLLGVTPDSIKILIVKDFIRQLNEDQVVVITDWSEHNTIRADRKVNSIYKDLLIEKCPEIPLVMPKPRADTGVIPRQLTTGRPVDGISKVKLSKVKLSKVKLENTPQKEARLFFNNPERQEEVFCSLVAKGLQEQTVRNELAKFISYWTEPNKSGTKHRWELEVTFEIGRRLATWFSRTNSFAGNNKTIKSI